MTSSALTLLSHSSRIIVMLKIPLDGFHDRDSRPDFSERHNLTYMLLAATSTHSYV